MLNLCATLLSTTVHIICQVYLFFSIVFLGLAVLFMSLQIVCKCYVDIVCILKLIA